MATVVIVNPKAGAGRGPSAWRQLCASIASDAEVFETRAPGHATELAAIALKFGARNIVAVGGDGTINEVVNGFFEKDRPIAPEAELRIVPAGTGSDFWRAFRRGPPRIQADVLRVRYTSHAGIVTQRYAINMVSFGMGGATAARAHRMPKILGGRMSFVLAMVTTALQYRGKNVRLTVDGLSSDFHVTNIAVGNGRFHGAGMWVCPGAEFDDGLADITVMDYLPIIGILRRLPMLYNGSIRQHPGVRQFRAVHLRAESAEKTQIEIDGEPLGALPVEIDVLPRAIRIVREFTAG